MKFSLLFLSLFMTQSFIWAEVPLNKKTGIIHIEHPDHVPHHPKSKDPTEKGSHDGIIYPRKKIKKGLLGFV